MRWIFALLCTLGLTLSAIGAGETVDYKLLTAAHVAKTTMSYAQTTAGDDSCDVFWGTTGSMWTGLSSAGTSSWTFILYTAEDYDLVVDVIKVAPLYIVGSAIGDTLCGEAHVETNGASILSSSHTFDGVENVCDVPLGSMNRSDGARLYVHWTNAATTAGVLNIHVKGPKK